MKHIKLYEDFVNESKEKFPDQVTGNDGIIFKKVSQTGDRAKYYQYYRGYDIDAGGHVFGSVAELERFMKDYILSNNLYNKYKHMPEKPIDESIEEKELKRYGNELWNRGGLDERKHLLLKRFGADFQTEDLVELPWSELPGDIRREILEIKE
jgi:hypothetical protein